MQFFITLTRARSYELKIYFHLSTSVWIAGGVGGWNPNSFLNPP